MALVFKVEDGSGFADSNSYCSVADADNWVGTVSQETGWYASTTTRAVKESALIRATALLDLTAWYGRKRSAEQALEWPRTQVYDRNGYTLSSDTIPTFLKNATAELARFLIAADRTSDPRGQGISEVKVDTVEVKFDRMDRRPTLPTVVRQMISAYGVPMGIGTRVVTRA